MNKYGKYLAPTVVMFVVLFALLCWVNRRYFSEEFLMYFSIKKTIIDLLLAAIYIHTIAFVVGQFTYLVMVYNKKRQGSFLLWCVMQLIAMGAMLLILLVWEMLSPPA